MARLRAFCVAFALSLAVTTGAPVAQSVGVAKSDILVLDPEQLFEATLLGQAIAARLQEERDALAALNRELEAQLEAEEQALTLKRDETSAEEFRDLADAFDEKVQQIREDSERRVRQHERNRERAPIDFLRQVEPVLAELMREAGASVVMDRRNVLYRADVVDITAAAVQRIDAQLGSGVDETQEAPESSGNQ